ncbi:MAG: hypothetical protein CMP89_11655 [Gammaproteobacteria bacterium]|nr:hypothetical protein [Gammaproteobacteria bacterium]
MKAAVFHGPRDVRFEEIDKPILAAGEVLLKVGACGICGSDLHTYRHGMFLQLGSHLNGLMLEWLFDMHRDLYCPQ